MNKDETARLLIFIKNHFEFFMNGTDEIGQNMMINSWHSFFEDIPVEVMVKVVQKHILTHDKAPTVKQLREEAVKLMNPVGAPLSPEMAWEKGRKTVVSFGRYNKDRGMERLREIDPAIARAINAVGWERICDATDETLAFRKREFVDYYSETTEHEKQEFIMPQNILGRIREIQAQQLEAKDEPKQIGDTNEG
jgi:hypothetical protein